MALHIGLDASDPSPVFILTLRYDWPRHQMAVKGDEKA